MREGEREREGEGEREGGRERGGERARMYTSVKDESQSAAC